MKFQVKKIMHLFLLAIIYLAFISHARGMGKDTAASFGALFFIGITAGRFISGFISEKAGDRKMIRMGTAIIFTGLTMLIIPFKSNVPAIAGLITLGLGCAPVYPSIIHSTPRNFVAENSQAIIGIQMAGAYVGSTFIPPLFGLIADHVSIKLFPLYMMVFFILMITMTEKTFNKVRNRD